MTTFAQLDLIEPLQRAVASLGYTTPTPIQVRAIPPLLEGRDVLGCAQTGTGKTAAFALPVLQHLVQTERPSGKTCIRVLVLSPTRELAAQIGESFETYGKHLPVEHTVIFGGVGKMPQVKALRRGVDVVVATPGRLLDLMGEGHLDLRNVEFFVLDEADRMLDMGFIHDIKKVLRVLPKQRQNLLFSATMPDSIATLAGEFLHDPVRVEVVPQSTTAERVSQKVMFVDKGDKRHLLTDILRRAEVERTIVFSRTKHGANRIVKQLDRDGIVAAAIHGNKSQSARERALDGFRNGEINVLVATDIAARGIDIDDVSHVVNFDLPNEPESYVHRIGRTARAGREGQAISFCDDSEGAYLRSIERLTGEPIVVDAEHAYHFAAAIPVPGRPLRAPERSNGGGGGGGGGGGRSRGRGGRGGQPRAGGGGGRSEQRSGASPSRPSSGGGQRAGGGQTRSAAASSGQRPSGGGGGGQQKRGPSNTSAASKPRRDRWSD